MKKSSLSLFTSYQGIGYISCIESKKRCPIKTLSLQSATNLSQGGVLERQRTLNFQLFWKMTLRRSRNALIKIPVLLVRSWPLPRHWQNRRQIKALDCVQQCEGQPLPLVKAIRSIIIMNHFLFSVNGTGVLLHAFGGV